MRVEARGLTRRFGEVVALRELDFEVPEGRRVALIGPNGSGKSTLNRCLMGLLRYEGTLRLGGRAPESDRVGIARHMAYVPQTPPSLAAPVGELVRALAGLREIPPAAVEKAAARLALDLGAVAGRPFRGLSGGMKQKVLVALALAARPSLLILDEPTGSLDAWSRERFFALVGELPRETSVVLCSHRLEEVRQLVDHVLLLEEGRLVYDGPAREFLARTATSVLEVRVTGERAARWLEERGFGRSTAGGFVRTVLHGEKTPLLRELVEALGAELEDATVRDLEALDLGEERRAEAAREG